MAEAVAGETGKPYVFVDPGAFINMFMGVGILKVKGLFRKLRKLALRYGGVIVFFDEADPRQPATWPAAAASASSPTRGRRRQWEDHLRWLSPTQRAVLQSSLGTSIPDEGNPASSRIDGRHGHGRRWRHAAGPAVGDVRPEEAQGLPQPLRPRLLGMKPKPRPSTASSS